MIAFSQQTSETIPVDAMRGDNVAETKGLREMLSRAEQYVKRFCGQSQIKERYVGVGVPHVVSLFLFRFDPPIGETDEWLWVVEGDLPSAYFVVDGAPNAAEALELYCELMGEWAEAVMSGASLEDLFPVEAAPDDEHAQMLLSRIKFLREKIIAAMKRR